MKLGRFAAVLAVAAVLAAARADLRPASAGVPNLGTPVSSDREWTVLIYIDADNNLETYGLADVKEIERGLSELTKKPEARKLDAVFMLDRAKGYDDTMGDWTGTRVYRAKPSERDDDISSELLADCGEQNMGDPDVLESFIREGVAKYPARHTALILWDHGGGWIAMLNDEDAPGVSSGSGMDEMTLPELESASRELLRPCRAANST